MSDTNDTGTDGGSRFPFINLEKAIGRAQELFTADQKGREMSTAAAFGVWNYSEKSSGGFQTIAALKAYGLGVSTTGKIGLSEQALRYFRDEREEEKKKLLRVFALKPKMIASLWSAWGAAPPADTVARSHLKAERGLSDQAARTVLAIYKENAAFAELTGDDMIPEEQAEIPGNPPPPAGKHKAAPPPPPPPPGGQQVKIMDGERIVFTEEGQPQQYLKLVAKGELDDTLLDALEDFVKRQRKRLAQSSKPN